MALGFAVLDAARFSVGPPPPSEPAPPAAGPVAAARAWWRGRGRVETRLPSGAEVAERGRAVAESTRVWFLVDSLDHLRRGGRLSIPAAAIGIVLGLRPILTLDDGGIELIEKVRTRRAARDRLVALAVAEIAQRPLARVAVHHLGQPDLAATLADELAGAAGDRLVGDGRSASPARCSPRTPVPASWRSWSPTPDPPRRRRSAHSPARRGPAHPPSTAGAGLRRRP